MSSIETHNGLPLILNVCQVLYSELYNPLAGSVKDNPDLVSTA